MSAQAGSWGFDGRPVDKLLLSHISQQLSACGPDEECTYADGSLGMLYRPFHTTAESRREHQPCVSPTGDVLTWDGRLDNRDDLLPYFRNQLPSDATDSDLVLAAHARWGNDSFEKFIGDWALALWDSRSRTLTLAVDYIGSRQLYYSQKTINALSGVAAWHPSCCLRCQAST